MCSTFDADKDATALLTEGPQSMRGRIRARAIAYLCLRGREHEGKGATTHNRVVLSDLRCGTRGWGEVRR